jgi:hypothetical protein
MRLVDAFGVISIHTLPHKADRHMEATDQWCRESRRQWSESKHMLCSHQYCGRTVAVTICSMSSWSQSAIMHLMIHFRNVVGVDDNCNEEKPTGRDLIFTTVLITIVTSSLPL